MSAQVIYDGDPMATRGKRGPISETAFAAGQALLERHPELDCVVLTLTTNDDPSMPSQNCVCFRDGFTKEDDVDKRALEAVSEAISALLKLGDQIDRQGLFGPKTQQG